jgi:hypothetical protein
MQRENDLNCAVLTKAIGIRLFYSRAGLTKHSVTLIEKHSNLIHLTA